MLEYAIIVFGIPIPNTVTRNTSIPNTITSGVSQYTTPCFRISWLLIHDSWQRQRPAQTCSTWLSPESGRAVCIDGATPRWPRHHDHNTTSLSIINASTVTWNENDGCLLARQEESMYILRSSGLPNGMAGGILLPLFLCSTQFCCTVHTANSYPLSLHLT